jgi:serine/threonine-protein kinase HipA
MAKRLPLLVSLYGEVVAELTSAGPGQITCRYTEQARGRWPLNLPLLSCSLPLTRRPHKNAGPFFRGLLPEGVALAAVAAVARVPTFDTYGILARFGRDIAGAAVISSDAEAHGPGRVVDYPRDELEEDVAALEERPLALHDDSELSLPGLQNKLLLVWTPHGWGRPAGGYPSTHILKVEDRRYSGMVTMEAACLHLARAIGLTSVEAHVERIGGLDCIIVSRYDRCVDPDSGSVMRTHQEDICQALGIDIDRFERRAKYQEFDGPGWRDAAGLLTRHAGEAAPVQLRQLLRATVFTQVIGNSDAHGKNLALVHPEPGTVVLAPLYDTVPTAMWPNLPDRAAMWVNGQHRLSAVTIEDLVTEARSWPMSDRTARQVVSETTEQLLVAIAQIDVPDDLATLVNTRARTLLGTAGQPDG